MRVEKLVEGIQIISKYIPIEDIHIWEDCYTLYITDKEGIKYSNEDLERMDELGFMQSCFQSNDTFNEVNINN